MRIIAPDGYPVTEHPDPEGFRKKVTRGWAHRPSLTHQHLRGIELYLKYGDPRFLPMTYKIIRKGMVEQGLLHG